LDLGSLYFFVFVHRFWPSFFGSFSWFPVLVLVFVFVFFFVFNSSFLLIYFFISFLLFTLFTPLSFPFPRPRFPTTCTVVGGGWWGSEGVPVFVPGLLMSLSFPKFSHRTHPLIVFQ